MVAAYLLPHSRIEMLSSDIGEISFLYIHQIQAEHVDFIACVTRIDGLNARDGRIRCRDLERISRCSMRSLHADFVLQVAVEGCQFKAFILCGNVHDDTVRRIHGRIEVSLLVIDVHFHRMVEVVTDNCNDLTGASLGEKTVGQFRVAGAYPCDFGHASTFFAVLTTGQRGKHEEGCKKNCKACSHAVLEYSVVHNDLFFK